MATSLRLDDGLLADEGESLAELYHESTKYTTLGLAAVAERLRSFEAWQKGQPLALLPAKSYAGARRVGLPRPPRAWSSLTQALHARRSRRPGPGPLTQRDVSALLWSAQGSRADGRRVPPSAGATYPLEIYLRAARVTQIEPALYHYDPLRHQLEQLGPLPDVSGWFAEPGAFNAAAVHLVVTAMVPRTRAKYGERAYRFVHLEAGHAMQNVLLTAAARKIVAVPIGGFIDDAVHDALAVDGVEEIALYTAALGPPPA